MNRLSHVLRRGALAWAATCVAASFAAAPASAVQLEAAAKCKSSAFGTSGATLTVSGDIPTSAEVPSTTAPVPLSIKLAWQRNAETQILSPGFSVNGEINLKLLITSPSGASEIRTVQAAITPIEVAQRPTPSFSAWPYVASGTLPPLALSEVGETKIDVVGFNPNVRFDYEDGLATTPPTDVDRNPVVDSDGDPETADIPCRFEPKVDAVNLARVEAQPFTCPPVILPPETPTAVESDWFNDIGSTTLRVRWGKPPVPRCGTPTASFRITYDGGKTVTVPASQSDVLIDRLRPGRAYTFTIEALDAGGFASSPLEVTLQTKAVICTDDLKRPPTPIAVPFGDGDIGVTSVRLRWQRGVWGACPREPEDGYRITYGDTTVTVPVTQTDVLISGLTPATPYRFEIASFNNEVGSSLPPLVVEATTKQGAVALPVFEYDLAGSTTLKTLTKGTLQLRGQIKAQLALATGAVTADLALNDTSGRLVAAGFLPVTAKVGFAPSGKTTGSLVDGVLKTNSKVRIKVKEVKLFGAIPLAGGNNCQTKNLSDINLQSTQAEFLPLSGGPLAGTYKISDLNGCGALNGLVSPLTAGGGNTIALNLTPKGATL